MSTALRYESQNFTGLRGRKRNEGAKLSPVKCQICGSSTIPGLDLGHQPVSDLLLSKAELNKPETLYPLRLHHCLECGLTQLSYTVNPKIVFKHFPFLSGTTQTATEHLQSLPEQLVGMLGLTPRSFAVDIGSNDGTLLKGYLPFGIRFLGIDPAGDPVRLANEQGIETLHAFFNEESASSILESYGKANAITACGVFAHIADLAGVMRGVKILLKKNGVFATDSQYWLNTARAHHYDNIFHQHLRYYSMKPLIHLFEQYAMDVFDVQRSDVYGGSIRVFACHSGTYPVSERVGKLVTLEEREGLYGEDAHQKFAAAVEQRRWKLFDAIYSFRSNGKKVIGIGAPAKATVVCNYCRLDPDLVEYVTEVNPLRVGNYLPGVHIPIVQEDCMFGDKHSVDAAVLFSWNYRNEILPKLRKRGFKGKILLP